MDHSATLFTIAQVAAAFAGFAGIATVIGQDGGDVYREVIIIRLRGMVESALIAVFGGLLPSILAAFPLPHSVLWRLASFCLLLAWLIEVGLIRQRIRRLDQLGRTLGDRVFRPVLWLILVVLGVILSANVLFVSELAIALYISAIGMALVVSAILFVRLLLGLIPG